MQQSLKSQLSYDDHSIINELTDKHQVSQKNTRLLIKYYTHFIKTLNIQTCSSALRKTLAEIALIFTEKSNFYRTVEGNQRPGICFSMNDILKKKSYAEIGNLLSVAKEVISTVKFREPNLKLQTLHLLTQIEKGLREVVIFQKMCWLFIKNTLENSAQTQCFKEKLITFSWYLYIDVKTNCFNIDQSFEQKKMLMVSVLETIILNSLNHLNPIILQKNSPKRYSITPAQQKKEVMSSILEILLKQAEINPSEIIMYQEINQIFNGYFDHLVSTGTIKSFCEQYFDFLCPRSLEINFRKIDRKISKEIQSNQIDFRKLLSYEFKNQKDHKKTAIQDKLILKQKKSQKSKISNAEPLKKYKSHRVLNLDECEIQMTTSSVITESQINFPSNLFGANVRASIPGLCKRSQKDELKRFLIQKVRNYMGQISTYEASIMNYIERTFLKIQENTFLACSQIDSVQNEHVLHAYEFYAWLADNVWSTGYKKSKQYILEENDSTHQCVLILAIGTILLCQNLTETQNPFVMLLEVHRPGMMDLFFTLICVQEMDLPLKLKSSFKELMESMVNEKIWNDQAFIEEINTVVENIDQIHNKELGKLPLTCILEQASLYVSQITQSISQKFMQTCFSQSFHRFQLWNQRSIALVLSLTTHSPQILLSRTLDQIILCSMYGMSKFLKLSVRFHELIEAYHETLPAPSLSKFENTILYVKNSFSDDFNDIIGFYNSEFVGCLNFAFEVIRNEQVSSQFRQKMDLVYELCGKMRTDAYNMSPFDQNQEAIILSPRLKKCKSQTHTFRSTQRLQQKENYESNSGHSININFDHEGQLGIVSFVSDESQKSLNHGQKKGKIQINLEINPRNSRNPTRVKQRRLIEEKEGQLCATHKGKHPIFTEFSKIDDDQE